MCGLWAVYPCAKVVCIGAFWLWTHILAKRLALLVLFPLLGWLFPWQAEKVNVLTLLICRRERCWGRWMACPGHLLGRSKSAPEPSSDLLASSHSLTSASHIRLCRMWCIRIKNSQPNKQNKPSKQNKRANPASFKCISVWKNNCQYNNTTDPQGNFPVI